jgi:hypothetical protein
MELINNSESNLESPKTRSYPVISQKLILLIKLISI